MRTGTTKMDNIEKAQIMYEHLVTDKTYSIMQNDLGIYADFINSLSDEGLNRIVTDRIFFNAFYSPASNSQTKVAIPVNSKVITFDANIFSRYPKSEQIAMLLHEMGHAVNPTLTGEAGEFAADDFAIKNRYSTALKKSLENFVRDFPKEFDKPITHKRIARITEE